VAAGCLPPQTSPPLFLHGDDDDDDDDDDDADSCGGVGAV